MLLACYIFILYIFLTRKKLKNSFKKNHTSIIIPLYNEEARLNYCFYIIPKFIYGIPLYNLILLILSSLIALIILPSLKIQADASDKKEIPNIITNNMR